MIYDSPRTAVRVHKSSVQYTCELTWYSYVRHDTCSWHTRTPTPSTEEELHLFVWYASHCLRVPTVGKVV